MNFWMNDSQTQIPSFMVGNKELLTDITNSFLTEAFLLIFPSAKSTTCFIVNKLVKMLVFEIRGMR
jgi:hypothetical protein